MNNNNQFQENDLPSAVKLVKSTLVAAVLAIAILIAAVLPAEYGIDPTGVGSMLGLTKMGEIKVSLAEEAAEEAAAGTKGAVVAVEITEVVKSVETKAVKSDSITVSLAPNEAREVKVKMAKGGKVSYSWQSDAGRANFDVHGDSVKHNIRYFNYSKGSAKSDAGELEAAFDGKHGWFWRNRSGKPLNITLKVEGEFVEMTQEV